MPTNNPHVDELIFLYLQENCSLAQLKELHQWIESSDENRKQFEQLTNHQYISLELEKLYSYDESKGWEKIKDNLNVKTIHKRPNILFQQWRRISIAAVAVLVTGALYFIRTPSGKPFQNTSIAQHKTDDVLPGKNKAMLTLSNGSKIVLDGSQSDTIAQQGSTKVLNLDGKVSYLPGTNTNKEILYNTISTPAGGQYQVNLPDGSQVWLNASSSIRFPSSFTGTDRQVAITGEAYLEVAHNKKMPFIVAVNDAKIKVLGTSFDVMAYPDESATEVTLLEGSVNFTKDEAQAFLKPGEQSRLSKTGNIRIFKDVDIDKILAWKNGFFYFDNADIQTVMRQLSRWYDVNILYRNKNKNDLFHADIPRTMTLAEVLKALELAGGLHFEIQGRNIIVL